MNLVRSIRNNMEDISSYRHFLLMSIYGLAQIWFSYLEDTLQPKYYMYSMLDAYIPFTKIFVLPYLFWFVYMAGAFIYLGLVSKQDYYRLCIFIFGGMGICYIIYTLFPSAQNLRPIIMENDILSNMIKYIYATDTPTNVAPSIHVLNSIGVHIALVNCPDFARRKWAKNTSLVIMILICASTVFIKQHSIKDGMWAILLSIVLYALIYYVPKHLPLREEMVVKLEG